MRIKATFPYMLSCRFQCRKRLDKTYDFFEKIYLKKKTPTILLNGSSQAVQKPCRETPIWSLAFSRTFRTTIYGTITLVGQTIYSGLSDSHSNNCSAKILILSASFFHLF